LGVRARSLRANADAEPSISAILTGAALRGEVAAAVRREGVASSAESSDEERRNLPREPALEQPLAPLARELRRHNADRSDGRPPRDHRAPDATTSGPETRSDATTVHVTIGRIEVRAPQTAYIKPAVKTAARPRSTLDEYLRARMIARR
jgi:hypothetical protein